MGAGLDPHRAHLARGRRARHRLLRRATTSSRCSTWPTWARSRCTSGRSRVAIARAARLVLLDLDPKGAPFTDVVKVARALRAILDELELPSLSRRPPARPACTCCCRSARRYTYEQTRDVRAAARHAGRRGGAGRSPPSRGAIGTRGGKVYVDFGQNGPRPDRSSRRSRVRPLPGAPVSMPLRWREVNAAARSRAVHDPHGAGAPREARRIRWRRCSGRASTSPPRSAAWIARDDGAAPWYPRGHVPRRMPPS